MPADYPYLGSIHQGDHWSDAIVVSEGVPATAEPVWAVDTAYTAGTKVAYDGEVWTAAVDNTGEEPTRDSDFWTADERPRDLMGWTVRMQLRTKPSDPRSTTVTVSTPDETGVLHLSLLPEATAVLSEGSQAWDLETTSPTGVVETYLKGTVPVTAEVTR